MLNLNLPNPIRRLSLGQPKPTGCEVKANRKERPMTRLYHVSILEHKTIEGLQERINHWLDNAFFVGMPTITLSHTSYSHIALIIYQDGP